MNINLFPFTVLWALLALVVLVLIVYRKMVAAGEEDVLRVLDERAGVIPRQAAIAKKLEHIDRWGQGLTVIVLAYGLVIAAAYLYQGWVASSKIVY